MKKIPINYIAIVLLLTIFCLSLFQVLLNSYNAGEFEGDAVNGLKIIRIAHWQLEPGYRAAVDKMIARYNQLPAVKKANIRVIQVPVTEKVYGQWLNVQLMSGTAPDICEKGMAKMASGDYIARYFEPLGDYAAQPNPYNALEFLPKEIPPQLARTLSTKPWRETFNDGMRGGWDDKLQNYYAVPTSFFGAIRLYYNRKLIAQAKSLISEELKKSTYDSWMAQRVDEGYVVADQALAKWAVSDAPPNTLGRLLLSCSAIREIAKRKNQDKLVPMAGSTFSQAIFSNAYNVPFTSPYAADLDLDDNSTVTALETFAGWEAGVWRFDHPRMKAYYQCIEEICRQFPPGFLALGRDQAINRFVLGQASMVASGAWDANSILKGASAHSNPDENFEVGIMPFPLPAKGEKWSEFATYPANEAQNNAGAPYAISQRSPHVKWAINFLQYMSSFSVNQQFNRDAGWIPVVMGTSPTELMKPFSPNPNGLAKGTAMNFRPSTTNIRTIYEGQLWLYMSGDIGYEAFSKAVVKGLEDPRAGVLRLWNTQWESLRNNHRNNERMLATQKIREIFQQDTSSKAKYIRGVFKAASTNNGNRLRQQWARLYPDKPFPEY